MADHQMSFISVLNIIYPNAKIFRSLVRLGGTLDPQGRIKGSPQVSINFCNSATIAHRAFKLGLYMQSTC